MERDPRRGVVQRVTLGSWWRTVMTLRASPRFGDFASPSLRSAPPSERAHTLSLELQNILTCSYPALALNSTDHEPNVAQRWALSLWLAANLICRVCGERLNS